MHAQLARLPVAPEPAIPREDPFELSDSRLDSITRRLEALEDENRSLRALVEQQADATDDDSDTGHCVREEPTGCTSCTESQQAACEGLPDLCDACLEHTSWNKAGGWRVIPFGRLRGDFIYSSAPYTNDTIIAFLNPETPGVSEDATAVSAKQSQINFAISGPSHNGWDTEGIILINFMGAQPLRNFSGANIVLANAQVSNDRWRFAFGRMLDLFGPISPQTVNQIEQRGAGNVGIYRGVLHVDRYLKMSDAQQWTLSSRLSQPDITDYAAVPLINGQNNGWPNIEARIGVELGHACDYGRPVELGISGVVGELQAVLAGIAGGIITRPTDEIEQTRGVCLDAQFRGRKFGFRSEAWWGKAAGTYFVAVLQSINPETDQAIESVGGWGELYCNLNSKLRTHVGFGVDDPRNADVGMINPLGPGQITYNEVGWWNLLYDVTDNFELGIEVSHRRTNYLDPTRDNEGTLFHFSSTLNF